MHQPDPASFDRHDTLPSPWTLSPIERNVVMLARIDADRGHRGTEGTRFPQLRKLFALLTGVEGIQRLADERLETLRRFVCLIRHGDRRYASLEEELIDLGFTPDALTSAARIARG